MILIHSKQLLGVEVYWGVEYDIPTYDSKYVSHAWLIEDLPPYRRSRWGARIRAGNRALHFGTCIRADDPHRKLPEIPVSDISTWRGPHVQEEGSADTRGEQVRPPEQRQLVPDAGGEPRNGDSAG